MMTNNNYEVPSISPETYEINRRECLADPVRYYNERISLSQQIKNKLIERKIKDPASVALVYLAAMTAKASWLAARDFYECPQLAQLFTKEVANLSSEIEEMCSK